MTQRIINKQCYPLTAKRSLLGPRGQERDLKPHLNFHMLASTEEAAWEAVTKVQLERSDAKVHSDLYHNSLAPTPAGLLLRAFGD